MHRPDFRDVFFTNKLQSITLAEIFRYKETGYDKNRRVMGQFQSTGTVPSFVQEIKDKGGFIPMEIFSNDPPKAVTQAPPAKKVG